MKMPPWAPNRRMRQASRSVLDHRDVQSVREGRLRELLALDDNGGARDQGQDNEMA